MPSGKLIGIFAIGVAVVVALVKRFVDSIGSLLQQGLGAPASAVGQVETALFYGILLGLLILGINTLGKLSRV